MEGNEKLQNENLNTQDSHGFTFEVEMDGDGSGLVFDSSSLEEPSAEPVAEGSEISVPDSFVGGSSSSDEEIIDAPLRFRTTYVPRFTDASENYRKIRSTDASTEIRARELDSSSAAAVKNENKVDPTAELDEAGDAVVVTTGNLTSAMPADESISVFKFSPDAESAEESIQTVPDNTEPLDAEPEAADIHEEVGEQTDAAESLSEPRELPDPELDGLYDSPRRPVAEDTVLPPLVASDARGALRRSEYVSTVQRDSVKDRFLDLALSVKVRLISMALLFLISSAAGICSILGVRVSSLIGAGAVAGADAFIDLQLAVCLALLALPEIISAHVALFRGRLHPELFLTVSLGVLVAYTVVTMSVGTPNYPLFSALYGIQTLCTVVASLARRNGELSAFLNVSKNTQKSVVENRSTRELPRENLALDGAVDEYSSRTSRHFQTAFVSDFFTHVSQIRENSANMLLLILVSLGVALLTGASTYFISGADIAIAIQSFTLVFMLAIPSFSILIHKIPFRRLGRLAEREGSVYIGEEAVYDCASVDVITYEDTEIFGTEDVTVKKVHLYGKAYNTAKAMRQMYAIFSVVGGPLESVFSAALDKKCESAEDVVVEQDGIYGKFEGHTVLAGSLEFMKRHGAKIPEDDYRITQTASDSTKILYGAEDGEVYVKFFIRYSFSEQFTMLLPILKEEGITLLVYTRDPNITNQLVLLLTMGDEQIRVMKKTNLPFEEKKLYRRISALSVTHGGKDESVNMILYAKKYASLLSVLSVMELVSMIVGAVLGIAFSVAGMFSVPPVMLALWQLAWCVVVYVLSGRVFGLKRKRSTEEE